MILVLALFLQSFWQFEYPNLPTDSGTSSCALNSASVRCADSFWIHRDVDVKYVLFRIGTVTAGDTIRVSLQYADSSGIPTGTPLVSSQLTVTSGMANTWQEVEFANPLNVTSTPRSLFVIFDYENYGGGNLNIVYGGINVTLRVGRGTYNGSSWSWAITAPASLLRKSNGEIIGLDFLGWVRAGTSVSSNSNPDEGGIACTFDRALRVVGMQRMVLTTSQAGISQYRIYQGSTLLWSGDSPMLDTTAGPGVHVWLGVPVAPSITLRPGVEYIFAWRPTTTSSSSILFSNPGYPATYNNWFTAYTGGRCRIATRVDDGSWQYNTGNPLFYVRPVLEEVHGGVQ